MTDRRRTDSREDANDRETRDDTQCTVEIWRNRVIGHTGFFMKGLDGFTRLLGGPYYHLYLVVKHGPCTREPGEYGRYEIYEPRSYPPRGGDKSRPVSFGGFLQRRRVSAERPEWCPEWDTQLVFAQRHPPDSHICEFLTEANLREYRWRDHYPRWWDNLTGRWVNSNTFVEKVVEACALKNRDGSHIDLTSQGRFSHPGLGRGDGWTFHFPYGRSTDALHQEWHEIHRRKPPGTRGWLWVRQRLRGRFVPAKDPEWTEPESPSP